MKPVYKLNRLVFFAGLWILAVALFMSSAFAQNSGAGTITGTLTDPAGSVVPGAAVAVRNANTGATVSLVSNGAGIYVAPFLPPGMYEITASKAGFGKIARTNLTLQVGQTMTIDIALPLQTTTDTVTVSSEASVVDTQKTDMSQVVSATQQENLPLAGRRWESFALMTPNVTNDGGSGLVSYRGISGLYNQSAVDGANNSQAFFSETKGRTTIPYIYSMDSIQEFAVTSSNYSAELGQAAGGVVNAVTKSGTNALHGDLFYYLRYPSLNAFDSFTKAQAARQGVTNISQPVHQQQQFGGSFGGPIIKDKLFFFGTYDGSRKIDPISFTSTQRFPISRSAAHPRRFPRRSVRPRMGTFHHCWEVTRVFRIRTQDLANWITWSRQPTASARPLTSTTSSLPIPITPPLPLTTTRIRQTGLRSRTSAFS